MEPARARHIIGAIVVDLVKFLKTHERASGCVLPLSPRSRAVLDRRIQISDWVPIEVFHELLQVVDVAAIQGDERRAMEIGAAGSTSMRGLLKAYAVQGDPASSVLAMRHAWRAHYDFGRLTKEQPSNNTVHVTVAEYPDMPMVHGMMTVGWGVAAARAAGASDARAVVFDRPWHGATQLRYEVSF